MSSQLANLFRYLPAGYTTGGLKIGLSVITAVLGTLCWLRATTSLYSYRCMRHRCKRGALWFLFSVLEGAAVTALYAAVAVLTPPGSTCFLHDDQRKPLVSTFTTYNILTAATLLSFSVPRMLEWLMCLAELVGLKVRTASDSAVACSRAIDGSDSMKGQVCSRTAVLPESRGFFRQLFDNDQLEWFVWQMLPCGSVLLYQISTAYYSSYSPEAYTLGCTTSDKSWLIALVAVIGCVGFFVTLCSFEYDCFSYRTTNESLFRGRGVAYRFMALVFSVCTAGSFVAVALLTPPAGPCLFPGKYNDGFLQLLGTCLLPGLAAAALFLGLVRYFTNKRAMRYDVTAQPAPSAPPLNPYENSGHAAPLTHQQQFVASSV